MNISQKGLNFIKEEEGLRLTAYQCSADKWTIGYGHTEGVRPGMKITEFEAEQALRADVQKFAASITALVQTKLTQSQFDALVSFAFNVGIGNFKSSTLLKLLNQGAYDRVPNEFSKWVYITQKGKKVVSKGLTGRRAREAALFMEDDETDDAPAGAVVTRATPSVITKENLSFGAGLVSASGLSVSTLAEGDSPVQWALAIVILVGAAAGLFWFFKRRGK